MRTGNSRLVQLERKGVEVVYDRRGAGFGPYEEFSIRYHGEVHNIWISDRSTIHDASLRQSPMQRAMKYRRIVDNSIAGIKAIWQRENAAERS